MLEKEISELRVFIRAL